MNSHFDTNNFANLAIELSELKMTPTVVFDLDDTLFDTRERTKKILHEFVKSDKVDSGVRSLIDKMTVDQVSYFLRDTLENIGIYDLALKFEIEKFWQIHFFPIIICFLMFFFWEQTILLLRLKN